MAKIFKSCSEVQELVQKVALETGLTPTVEFEAFSTDKAKDIVKVKRADEIAQIMTNKDTLVGVIIYEEAFSRFDEKSQWLLIKQELDKVSYDFEKEKLSLTTPMITIPLSSYQKYGNIAIQTAEAAILTIQQIEDERKMRKEEQKANKKNKK